jgi:hypothetical protein
MRTTARAPTALAKRWTVRMDGVPLPLSMRVTTLWVVPMRAAMMCLSVNLTPVANLHHKDAQSAVLNVANYPASPTR